jgi:hypothetical protein
MANQLYLGRLCCLAYRAHSFIPWFVSVNIFTYCNFLYMSHTEQVGTAVPPYTDVREIFDLTLGRN